MEREWKRVKEGRRDSKTRKKRKKKGEEEKRRGEEEKKVVNVEETKSKSDTLSTT